MEYNVKRKVTYTAKDGRTIIPDFSIPIETDIPRFAADINKDNRELYIDIGIEEYWIIQTLTGVIMRYLASDDFSHYILHDCFMEANKDKLDVLSYPKIKVNYDDFFEG